MGKHVSLDFACCLLAVWSCWQVCERPALAQENPEVRSFFPKSRDGVDLVVFSPDSKRIAAVAGGNRIEIWELASGERKYHARFPKRISCLSFTPDGKGLVFGEYKEIRFWDWGADKEIMSWKASKTIVKSLAFSADGTRLAATFEFNDNRACVWDAKTGQEQLAISFPKWELLDANAIAFSPDGKRFATAHFTGVFLWDVQTGKNLSRIINKGGLINSLTLSKDGKRLGVANTRGVSVWDMPAGVEHLKIESEGLNSGCMSPCGEFVAVAGPKDLRVLSVATKKELLKVDGRFMGLAFSPDSKSLAYVNPRSIDGEVIVQNITNLKGSAKEP